MIKNNKNDSLEVLIDYFKSKFNIGNISYNDINEVCVAFDNGEPDAVFIISVMIIRDIISIDELNKKVDLVFAKGDALEWLMDIADDGYMAARVYLNNYFAEKKESYLQTSTKYENYVGPLVDYNGKQIKVNRKGTLTPIDAELKYLNGNNVLKLSVNLFFAYSDIIDNRESFENSVVAGIKNWEGDYLVFGGQKLKVEINITTDMSKLIDSVYIVPVTDSIKTVINKSHRSNNKVADFVNSNRDFAIQGFIKWSVYSRKYIYIVSKSGKFDEYSEIAASSKHEFGHALGLGDLYFSEKDDLYGVGVGSYPELDTYNNGYRNYNLVMCDHNGPISNNDIEMITLAFRDNEAQLYQKKKRKDKISEALGNGN